ncbi:MAG: hypothetical protein AB7D39_11825 [Pseudodesulfovibrio sp.]|uniref:hypothetical protein n=1 Tax=Pseudodesulfovibrio sp. TaxID=2035812 RepID=UPI003D0DA179
MKKQILIVPFITVFFLSFLAGIGTAKAANGAGVSVSQISIVEDGSLVLTLQNALSVEVSNIQATLATKNSAKENDELLKSQPSVKLAPKTDCQIHLADAAMVKNLVNKYETSFRIIGCGTSPNPPSTGGTYSYTEAVPLALLWGYTVPSGARTRTLQGIFIYLDLLKK